MVSVEMSSLNSALISIRKTAFLQFQFANTQLVSLLALLVPQESRTPHVKCAKIYRRTGESKILSQPSRISMRVLIDVMNENFATKSDLGELELRIDARFDKLEAKLDYRLTIKLGTMMTFAIGVTATFVKLLETAR